MTIAWLAKVVNGSKVGTAVDLMLSAVPASCVGERRPLIQLIHQRAQRRVVSVTRDQELFTLLGGIAEKAGAIFRAIIALRRESRQVRDRAVVQPLPATDTLVAMVSPHVDRGRCNLAAATIGVMRRLGIEAFQTCSFPNLRRR